MKKTFAILFASTALTVGVGLPALSAMHAGLRLEDKHENTIDNTRGGAASAVLVSDDEEVDLHHRRSMRRDGDDDHRDDDDEEGDDGYEGGAAAGPAPVGTIAPPDNGLFGSGAVPKVKVN